MNHISDFEVGEVVELFSVPGEPLPIGLADGFQVRLVGGLQSDRIVEREGREWRVKPAQIRRRRLVGPGLISPRRCRQ